MRPVCRPASTPDSTDRPGCAGRASLAAHGLTEVWGGPPVDLGAPLSVALWAGDGGVIKMATPTAVGTVPVEQVAQWLAAESGHPRYGGERWRMLLADQVNAEHAFRCAEARDIVPPAQLRSWLARVTGYHRNRETARHTAKSV